MSPTVDRSQLQPPACYRPWRGGRYRVEVGLRRLGTDFGNGTRDHQVFQLDDQWPRYRANKLEARREQLRKYYCRNPACDPGARTALVRLIVDKLVAEHPRWFLREPEQGRRTRLHCRLTGETLTFDEHMNLEAVDGGADVDPPYTDAVDALACQLQEDLALTEWQRPNADRLTLLHLCNPNHWGCEDKIGGHFAAAHAPVPHFQRIAAQTEQLMDNMIHKGPFVRFAWGLATDSRLNHHPAPPDGTSETHWNGRRFDPRAPALFVRVERQVIHGLPEARAMLFAIRTYFEDAANLRTEPELADALARAVESMDEDTLQYKGLAGQAPSVVQWLRGG